MAEGKMTAAERKRIESLDRRIEKQKERVFARHHEYDEALNELQQLLDERYPEKKEERIRTQLYETYQKSQRSLEEILAFMEGRDDEIDW